MKIDVSDPSNPSGSNSGPLSGIRVIDLTTVVSGPLCAQILGDMGAEVLKIEAPQGDSARRMGPPFRGDFTGLFLQCNRNKRSLVLDLKVDDAADVVRRLAREADILIENFRPGVTDRLGIGYERLREENPRLIYAAISGFGPDGPYSTYPAYDTVIQGLAGATHAQGDEGPELIRSIAADKTASLTATYAITSALFARERGDGTGQRIDIPMLDSYVAFAQPDVFAPETFVPRDEGMRLPNIHRIWNTKDGHIVVIVIEDHQFQAMCRALDREDLIDDPRCNNLIARLTNMAEIFELLEEELKLWNTEEIVARARKFGAPVAPANDIHAMLDDPQVQHSKIVFDAEHPSVGGVRYLRNPVRFEHTPTSLRHHPPALGEQTDEVLAAAGYDAAEIAALRESGALG